MDDKVVYIKSTKEIIIMKASDIDITSVTVESTISTSNETIVISGDDETDDEATICSPMSVNDGKIIVISSDDEMDGEATKSSPSSVENGQLVISASGGETDGEAAVCGQASVRDDQQGSSFLNTILTAEELKLREPLPVTNDSDEYEAELEKQPLNRVKRLTKKRPIQVSVSQMTVKIEKKN